MKKTFENEHNFIEVKSTVEGHVVVVLSSVDINNPRKTIVNSVELTSEEWKQLISDINHGEN